MSESTTIRAPKTLGEVIADLWQAKGAIMLGALAGLALAIVFIALARPHYRAQMILSPVNAMNGADVSSLMAEDNLFAVRYLVQRVGVANSGDFTKFETIYGGPSVAALLLKDPAITRGVREDKTFSFQKTRDNWNAAELAEYIDRTVSFENVGTTAMRRLVYKHPDPNFATYFLKSIHRATDELIRTGIRQEAAQHVRYLQGAIDDTRNPEHRKAMTALLMEQQRLLMLVSIESPYAAGVIEPAAASSRAVWPSKTLILPAGTLIGALMGFVWFSIGQALAAMQPQRPAQVQKRQEPVVAPSALKSKAAAQRDTRKYGYWWKMDSGNANQPAEAQEQVRDGTKDAAE